MLNIVINKLTYVKLITFRWTKGQIFNFCHLQCVDNLQ